MCAPHLPPGSAVALTLRAVGGLTTRQIATAYLVPESTMAQRISRAKRRIAGLLALMLLHHARRAPRTGPGGRLVPLAEQDWSRWDTGLITEGVTMLPEKATAGCRERAHLWPDPNNTSLDPKASRISVD